MSGSQWFLVDAVAVPPFALINLIQGDGPSSSKQGTQRTVVLMMRALRALRIFKLIKVLKNDVKMPAVVDEFVEERLCRVC